EGVPGHFAQMIGDRRGGSEHAPHLIDAEGVETELTHDRHGNGVRPYPGPHEPAGPPADRVRGARRPGAHRFADRGVEPGELTVSSARRRTPAVAFAY